MEQPEKFFWLDEFLDSLQKSIGFMDLTTLQPTSWRHFQPLISAEWLEWFWQIVETREQKNIPYEHIAQNFEPDLCREHLLFTLEDLKSAHWPLVRRLKIADFFYQTLKAQMPQGDLFGWHGSTKRHSAQEVKQLMRLKFTEGTPYIARELGKLYNGAYNLGAALYLDFYMGKAIENWGSYELPDGNILVVKQMRNLKPIEIWPNIETQSSLINLYTVYQGVTFSTDLIACHTQYQGDTLQGLKHWRLERDGSVVTEVDEIKNIADNLGHTGAKQWEYLKSLPEPELLEKGIWIRCYCFNKVCEALGLDWRPTEALLKAVGKKTLSQGWQTWKQPEEQTAYQAYWRNIWDPRAEFYP